MYDAAIIGTGAAGISAALNLKIHHKRFLWFGAPCLSDKIHKAEQVLNYPGFSAAKGEELAAAFQKQVKDMELEIDERMVLSLYPMGEHYGVVVGNDFYEAKTVILATGVAATQAIPGEEDFLGRGVSYCATCDGNLYKGKTIAVVCNHPRFEGEVRFLAQLADKVYYFPSYQDSGVVEENVETILAKLERLEGEERVERLVLGKGRSLAVEGVFCLRDSVSFRQLLSGLEMDEGHIRTNRDQSTNLPGVFAAGDCTGRPYQYAKAVGEGNVAAHSVLAYLASK